MIAYIADTSTLADNAIFNRLYSLTSNERKRKTDSLRYGKDKCLSVGVETLLMSACRDFGIDYASQQIDYDDYKKPFFTNGNVYFNLSHSESRAMCVMADRPVGCDVEKIADIDLDIARNFFFSKELDTIENCTAQTEKYDTFFRLWTLKESFMKCTGLGFHLPLNEFEVSVQDCEPTVRQNVDNSTYKFYEWNADDGYKYAVCIKNQNCNDKSIWKQVRLDGQAVF